MKILTVHAQNNIENTSVNGMYPIYDIVFSKDFSELAESLKPFNLSGRRVCIVSETRVAGFYLDTLKEILSPLAKEVAAFVFPEGEDSKNLSTVQNLYEYLILSHFDRKDLLIALGGGVVGDLTGYTAATYLRGIDFIQIPTSLLSQVDSSIGGKTGVDFKAYKNMVGAFHQPKLVYINLGTLKTLNERQFLSGMGEIIKHGLIKDIDYYHWMKNHREQILLRDPVILSELVYRSCAIKGRVVEMDPKEQGERALLNFGHTLGHAIEKLEEFSLLHGECVALGMVCAACISRTKGRISDEMFADIRETIRSFGLPVSLNSPLCKELSADSILAASKMDKKMEAGLIKFILLSPAGNAVIDKTVTDSQLLEAAKFIGAKF